MIQRTADDRVVIRLSSGYSFSLTCDEFHETFHSVVAALHQRTQGFDWPCCLVVCVSFVEKGRRGVLWVVTVPTVNVNGTNAGTNACVIGTPKE